MKRAGDRARPGLARDQDLHPRPRGARVAERDPARPSVRLPRHRVVRRRDAADDRLRAGRLALLGRRSGLGPARTGQHHARLLRARCDRPRLVGRRVLARDVGDPPPSGGIRPGTTPRCALPRGACCWRARTSRTAGRVSSTARSNPACAPAPGGLAAPPFRDRPDAWRLASRTQGCLAPASPGLLRTSAGRRVASTATAPSALTITGLSSISSSPPSSSSSPHRSISRAAPATSTGADRGRRSAAPPPSTPAARARSGPRRPAAGRSRRRRAVPSRSHRAR